MQNVGGFDEVIRNLNALADRVEHKGEILLRAAAVRTVNEAKQRAPWRDRTGNARRSIHEEFTKDAGGMTESIGIGVFYGVYLELSHGGKYRVIDPVVFGYGKKELQDSLKGLLDA